MFFCTDLVRNLITGEVSCVKHFVTAADDDVYVSVQVDKHQHWQQVLS